MKQLPSVSYLHQRVDYNPITGMFIWNHSSGSGQYDKRWNTMFAGKPVGTVDMEGYLTTAMDGPHYKLHRIAWKMSYGDDPVDQIDHINGEKSDNRICNLREATSSQNSMNRRRAVNNTSGLKGVCWNRFMNKWQAQIEINYKSRILGYFDTVEEAKAAYDAAANELFGTFARSF